MVVRLASGLEASVAKRVPVGQQAARACHAVAGRRRVHVAFDDEFRVRQTCLQFGQNVFKPRPTRRWKREDTGTFVPTLAEYKGRAYLVRDRGEVECLDPATGKTVWKAELPKTSASYYSSPALADGKIYAAREDGVVFVARVEGKFEVLAENHLGERLIASPVPVANRLLLRGEQHLFCVAAK